jgi:hypothetical protein
MDSVLSLISAKQVMKMILTLSVQESGRVKYIKRPGAVLEAGCMVARLELDDPSKVHPVCGNPSWLLWLVQVHPQRPLLFCHTLVPAVSVGGGAEKPVAPFFFSQLSILLRVHPDSSSDL